MMASTSQQQPEHHEYRAWDVPTRLFHWINAIGVLGLIATGFVILTGDAVGLSSAGRVFEKQIHVFFGYVVAVNLLWAMTAGIGAIVGTVV